MLLGMSTAAQKVLEAALALSDEDREELHEALIRSLEAAQRAELSRRIHDLVDGEVESVAWDVESVAWDEVQRRARLALDER